MLLRLLEMTAEETRDELLGAAAMRVELELAKEGPGVPGVPVADASTGVPSTRRLRSAGSMPRGSAICASESTRPDPWAGDLGFEAPRPGLGFPGLLFLVYGAGGVGGRCGAARAIRLRGARRLCAPARPGPVRRGGETAGRTKPSASGGLEQAHGPMGGAFYAPLAPRHGVCSTGPGRESPAGTDDLGTDPAPLTFFRNAIASRLADRPLLAVRGSAAPSSPLTHAVSRRE